ncbi:MAG: pyridoxal phosphate-dependent aminotransferase [Pollutimonas bauzanensis]
MSATPRAAIGEGKKIEADHCMTLNYQTARAARIKPSPSITISVRAKAMRAEGREVIDMSLGEPDFDTPGHIVEAAYSAMLAGQTRYTPPDGTNELKAAIAHKFKTENGLEFSTREISVGNGAKQVIYNALMATLEPDDEVVVPAPYWVSYTDMVILLGGSPVVVPCTIDTGFKLTPERLEAALTPRTRWLLLNSPSNPSGTTYTREELEALGAVLERHPKVFVMSDEIYEHILYDGAKFVSFLEACPRLRDRLLLVNGISKTYAMTGWRIGYGAGPAPLIATMGKLQSQVTSNPSSVSQAATIAALTGPQDFRDMALAEYAARRDIVVSAFATIEGMSLLTPAGAFYAFPEISGLLGKVTPEGKTIADGADFAAYLLETAGVAGVPGAAFGLDPYFRLSFALSQSELKLALNRISAAVTQLS